MPSGAKKRKAAKRKKEQEQQQLLGLHPPGSPTSTDTGPPHSPQGNGVSEEEDPMGKDSKEIESGSDVASPMAQDNHQCPIAVDDNDEQAEARGEAMGKGKKGSDSARLVEIVKVMDSAQIGDEELPWGPFPLQTEEDAKETEEVRATAVEVKKDEILPLLLLDPAPPASAGAPVSGPESFTIEHIQCEKGEDVCVQGERSPLVEHKHLEAVDITNAVERLVPISEEQTRDFLVGSLKVVQNVADAPTHKIEERVLHLSDATTKETSHLSDCQHGSDDCDMAGTTEVARSTKLEQQTSWLSCCGLFDVFMGVKR